MPIDRVPTTTSAIDVLDHVLDKGVVIDAWVRVSIAGIDLITVEARVVVASIATYLSRQHDFNRQWRRRDEDRVREELRDARAKIVPKH